MIERIKKKSFFNLILINKNKNPYLINQKNPDLISFVKNSSSQKQRSNNIGIAIGSWSSVFQISLLLLANTPGNTNAASPVGDASAKIVNGRSLVVTGQAPRVVSPTVWIIRPDMGLVPLAQLLNGSLNSLDASLLPHLPSRVVGVTASPIPIASDWLRVKGHRNAKLFRDPMQKGKIKNGK